MSQTVSQQASAPRFRLNVEAAYQELCVAVFDERWLLNANHQTQDLSFTGTGIMLALVVGAAAVMGACYGFCWLVCHCFVPHEHEVRFAVYLRCVDDEEAGAPPSDEEYVERATKINCRPAYLKLSVRAAVAAKKRFGLLPDTTANRDLISDYVR